MFVNTEMQKENYPKQETVFRDINQILLIRYQFCHEPQDKSFFSPRQAANVSDFTEYAQAVWIDLVPTQI